MALTSADWIAAVDAEVRLQAMSTFGVLARVQNNGEGEYTLTYHPERLRRGQDSRERVRMDEDLENARIHQYVRGASDPHWSATVVMVLRDEGQLVVRLGDGRAPATGDAFLLWPHNYLQQLSLWLRAQQLSPDLDAVLRDRAARAPAPWPEIAAHASLRRRQSMAMVLAGQSIAVLWGPPGTGKTYTLAHLAASLVRSGKRVLLLAPTRVAADTATLAIDSALEPERRPGLVLRTDLPDLYEAFATRGKHLLTWANADSRYHTIAAGFLRKKQQLLGRRSSAPESERPRLDHELAELRTQHEAAREAYKEEQAQLVAHAMVVCATIRQNQAKGWHKSFDQVLVDEASMMSVSDAMHLLVSSTTPTIFAGDHKQLGPISQAAGRGRETPTIAQPVAATWLGTSILELLDQRLSALRVQRVLLNEQSRMNPELCQVVSTTMYEGELVALNAPKPGLPPHLPAGICVLDSERPPRWLPAAPDLGRPSHLALATPQSAAAAVALARLLARSGHSVVLAAPFRAQAALLRRGVDDLGTIVRAGTVHRLQGQEADVAIYDPTKPHHPWPDQSREAPLMLNVAASRGRRAFVLCNGMTWLMRSTLLRPFLVAARVL